MTAPTSTQRGHAEKVYIDNDDDFASPTWAVIPESRDANWSVTAETDDVTNDGDGGITREEAHSVKITAGFMFRCKENFLTSQPYYIKLRDASISKVPVHVALTSGDIETAGKEVLEAWWTVTECSKSKATKGHVDVTVSLTPSSSSTTEKPVFRTTT